MLLENTIYNEYKHGLRLNATNSHFSLSIEGDDSFIGADGNSLVYIGTERLRNDLDVHEDDNREWGKSAFVAEFIDYELYSLLCSLNTILIRQFIDVRKEEIRIREDIEPDEDGVIRGEMEIDFPMYHHMSIRELFEPNQSVTRYTHNFHVGPVVYETTY